MTVAPIDLRKITSNNPLLVGFRNREYMVTQLQDSILSDIRVYGSSIKWMDLFIANKDIDKIYLIVQEDFLGITMRSKDY